MTTSIDIAIPVLDEEKYIDACLSSVLGFDDIDKHACTIYVLDGGSKDRTVAIAQRFMRQDRRVRLLHNPGRIQSCALNQVIRVGSGEYMLRLDAHSSYPREYLRLCLETSIRSGAENVGGIFITHPGGLGYSAAVVQALTTHRFGVGNSEFRVGMKEGKADTVPYGFFRRSVFERIGLYDERLVRGQDYELNRRIGESGGTVWSNPYIQVHYNNQPTLRRFLRKQFLMEAPYNAYMWYVAPYAFAPRHAVTGVFAAGVIGGTLLSLFTKLVAFPLAFVMAVYLVLAVGAALTQAVRYRRALHVLVMPVAFFLFHFVHGLGVLVGLTRLGMRNAPVQCRNEPWAGVGRFRAWPKQ